MSVDSRMSLAFYEVISCLLAVLEVHNAPKSLAEHMANEIEEITQRHVGGISSHGARGARGLGRLLDELESMSPSLSFNPLARGGE